MMSAFDQSFSEPSICFGRLFIETPINDDVQPQTRRQRLLENVLKTPADRKAKQAIDELLAQAQKALTIEERQEQYEILHGVEQKIDETETLVEACLQQLENHLSHIKSQRTSIYATAEQMAPLYVRARPFRIMFLRANRYDPKAAAYHLIRFLEQKHQLFGAKFIRDITLADLDDDDIQGLKSGSLQIAGRDNAGRVIVADFPGLRADLTLQSELRMRYYILMSLFEKEENQLSTFVSVVYSVGDMKDRYGGCGVSEIAELAYAMPGYMAACHLCTDNIRDYLRQAEILQAAPLNHRTRIKLHFGNQMECLDDLSTFGISQESLPLDPDTNQINLKPHLEWVESCEAIQLSSAMLPAIVSSSNAVILQPNDNDVLAGTGKTSKNRGNERLRALVKDSTLAYEIASKEERKGLVDSVIFSMKESGSRFLLKKEEGGQWKEMTIGEARKNVAQAFRNSCRQLKTGHA